MKYAFLIFGMAALAFSGTTLHGQQSSDDSMGFIAPLPARLLPASTTKAIVPTDAPDSPTPHSETTCATDEQCGAHPSVAAKFRYFTHQSFGPGAFVGALFMAGPEFAKPPAQYPKEWREGAVAFGRLYGDALAFQTAAQTGRFLTGVVVHEDPRYWASTDHNPLARAMHAIVFTAFDKSDSGHTTLAVSNLIGSASAGFVGTLYLPRGYNDRTHALQRMTITFGSFAGKNLVSEFSPALRKLGKRLHLPSFGSA